MVAELELARGSIGQVALSRPPVRSGLRRGEWNRQPACRLLASMSYPSIGSSRAKISLTSLWTVVIWTVISPPRSSTSAGTLTRMMRSSPSYWGGRPSKVPEDRERIRGPLERSQARGTPQGGGSPTPESPISLPFTCSHRTFPSPIVLASTPLDRIGTTLTGLGQSFLVSALARLANGRGSRRCSGTETSCRQTVR